MRPPIATRYDLETTLDEDGAAFTVFKGEIPKTPIQSHPFVGWELPVFAIALKICILNQTWQPPKITPLSQ